MVEIRPRPARLPALGEATTAVIHENLGLVLTFAFSWHALRAYGGWLSARRWYASDAVLRELPQQRATRAIIELAVMFRALDDARNIATDPYVATHPSPLRYGDLSMVDGTIEPLALRDVTNKIVHAERIEWDFANVQGPCIVCHAPAADHAGHRWIRATVYIRSFAAVCAVLAA